MKAFHPILGGFTAIAIVLTQTAIALAKPALSSTEILQTAQQITVKILVTSQDGTGNGSGVIVGRKGNMYMVLTNDHVACIRNQEARCRNVQINIRTPDGELYPVVPGKSTLPNDQIDVALLIFVSPKNYPIATLGNSNQIAPQDPLWIYGFGRGQPQMHRGVALGRSTLGICQASAFCFVALLHPGMSGSPILDAGGRVVGIVSKAGAGSASGVAISQIMDAKKCADLAKRLSMQCQVDLSPLSRKPPAISKPTTAEDYLIQATLQLDQNQLTPALQSVTLALSMDPKLVAAYLTRALVRVQVDDLQGALADFNTAIQLEPDNPGVFRARGNVYVLLKNYDQAIVDFQSAAELSLSKGDFWGYHNAMNMIENLKRQS